MRIITLTSRKERKMINKNVVLLLNEQPRPEGVA
jgi:hypothetical protein